MRARRTVTAAAVTIVLGALAFAPPAQAADTHLIQSWSTGRCVNLPDTEIRNGATVDANASCIDSRTRLWILQGVPGTGAYTVSLIRDQSMCLDANALTSPANGTRVQVWSCNGSTQQQWDLLPGYDGGTEEGVVLANRHATDALGRLVVLDVDATGSNRLQLWEYTGAANQVFGGNDLRGFLKHHHPPGGGEDDSDATSTIVSAKTGRCLDAKASESTQDGGTVQTYSCHGRSNQQWLPVGNWQTGLAGRQIELANGMCFDADATTLPANGTRVQVWECNESTQQGWSRGRTAGGYLIINYAASKAAGRLVVLDTSGSSVRLWAYTGGTGQVWTSDEINACYTWVHAYC